MDDRARWCETWQKLGLLPPAPAVFDTIVTRYGEAHRYYHTMQHVRECFAQLDLAQPRCEHDGEVELALWLHDAIYDPRHDDNEERSARLAEQLLLGAGAGEQVMARVFDLIAATRHDALPRSGDGSVVVDVDLGILAASELRFTEYEQQIRREYAWVPDPVFAVGRAEVLRKFLARDRIYSTPWFMEHCEARARANLARSLDRRGRTS